MTQLPKDVEQRFEKLYIGNMELIGIPVTQEQIDDPDYPTKERKRIIKQFLAQELAAAREEGAREAYKKSYEEIEQNTEQIRSKAYTSAVNRTIETINLFLATNKYGCRLSYEDGDIVFYEDHDERGNEIDLARFFSRDITKKIQDQLTNPSVKEQ